MSELFKKYKQIISSLTDFDVRGELDYSLLVEADDNLSIYYAPFDGVNPYAKLTVVGITPGKQQAFNALKEANHLIPTDLSDIEIVNASKNVGSFSGPMRTNLTRMLDYFRLNEYCNISSCSSLFNEDSNSVQFLSALPLPVLVDGKNYNGVPNMLKNPLLKNQIDTILIPIIKQISNSVFIPLGPKVEEVFRYLVDLGIVKEKMVLFGFSHPSGANMERILYLIKEKSRDILSNKTNPDKLDENRLEIRKKVSALLQL